MLVIILVCILAMSGMISCSKETAQYNLGHCYAEGLGVEQDYTQAVHWYRKAAEQGDTDAQEAVNRLGY
jgi:TPR repeat protein